jgi:hypothetical protein
MKFTPLTKVATVAIVGDVKTYTQSVTLLFS